MPQNRRPAGNATSFKPGVSGNPGGRPQGLASRIRELAPADQLAEYYIAIWMRDGKMLRRLGIKVGEITLSDRTKAADWLADRGYGKAPLYAPVVGEDPLELDITDANITAVLDDLAARRETKAAGEGVDGAVEADSEDGAATAGG